MIAQFPHTQQACIEYRFEQQRTDGSKSGLKQGAAD